MNYRHAYHAGNHADILKHVIMTRLLTHMNRKDKPYRVIDAHAGIGRYALDSIEAGKTGEWEGGIGKMAEPFQADVEALLAPYRSIVSALNPEGGCKTCPGSPEIAARMMRPQDHMIANELHPDDNDTLHSVYRRDLRIKVTRLDAEECINSTLPPPERRGLVVIDPAYEQKDEALKAGRMLAEGCRRFANGIFLLWYPLKANNDGLTCLDAARAIGLPGTLVAEMRIREVFRESGLAGSGVIIANAPWRLDDELNILVPALAERLGLGTWGLGTVSWLVEPV